MMVVCTRILVSYKQLPLEMNQATTALCLRTNYRTLHQQKALEISIKSSPHVQGSSNCSLQPSSASTATEKLASHGKVMTLKPSLDQRASQKNSPSNSTRKSGKREHHLWKKRDSAQSGQKALNLVRIVSALPNEKEAVYGTLDQWIAWDLEFPLIAAAKALRILRKRNQWTRVIQVAKWMLSKGQGATMTTYDTLLLAFDMDQRIDEAGSLWNMILHTHTRSISRRLFSRMISLYSHHNMLEKIIEVFADMEELGVKPDEDTVRRVAGAFRKLGQEDKRTLVLRRYGCKWKYIHFKGERVRVRANSWDD